MSISPLASPRILEAVQEADVIRRGHFELKSGRHSMIKVCLDEIVRHPRAHDFVLDALHNSVEFLGVEAIVPVPTGATRIVETSPVSFAVPVISPEKKASNEFVFSRQQQRSLRAMGRVAIFEDVVTTGGTPATVADRLRDINPDLAVHLIDGWLRGRIERDYAKKFASQTHIITKRLKDWAPEDCPHHGTDR